MKKKKKGFIYGRGEEGDREKMHVASRQIMPVPSREIMLLRLSPLRPKYEDGDNEA